MHERSDSRGADDGYFVSQQLYDVWNSTVQLGLVGELGAECQENVECTNAGRREGAISNVCKDEGEEDEGRTILCGGWTG